jgi:hypothetical protein
MGRSGGGKVKTIKKQLGNNTDELNSLFSQLLGQEDSLDPMIILDKYDKLKSEIYTVNQLLTRFNVNILDILSKTDKSFLDYKKDIEFFINTSNNEFNKKDMTLNTIVSTYKRIKECDSINKILILCKNLIQHKQSIANKDKLSDRFIYNEPGDELLLFSFTNLNFKFLFRHPDFNIESNKRMKPFIMLTLHLLFKVSYSIYDIITSPDIDIEKFSKIIISSISEAKKSIPRCDKAFNKISNSIDMLTGNFNNYYKDMVQSKNPSIILESFLSDLASDTDNSDMECVFQLKKIVEFYKNKTVKSGAIKDPRINQLFETIQDKFNMLDDTDNKDSDNDSDNIDVNN